MPAQLKPALEETFNLTETDKLLENTNVTDSPTTVTVIQVAQGAHDKRMKLWEEFKRSVNADGTVEITQRISPAEVRSLEVFLAMKACNLENAPIKEGDKPTPVFVFPLNQKAYEKAWASLPPAVADEIHSKVLEINPLWAGEAGE